MLIKDKLSRISLQSLIPSKKIPAPVVFTEEPLSSSPFVMPQNRKIDAPFTGRVKELDLMRSCLRYLFSIKSRRGSSKGDHGKPLVIGIKGEAGIGKSRLVTEFQKNITASHHGKNFIYRAGCVSSGQEAYGLFRGFFSKSNFLKQAVTAERRTLIKNTISENILSLAREAGKNDLPLVIMLEDMQWADELSLAALDHFVSAVNLASGEEDLMLFLLLNYRPSYRPGRVLRKGCRLVEIELKGFSESESKQFISKLTGSKKITTNAVEQISRRSEGNPFNIEELCRSLDGNSKHLKLPVTVRGLLADKVSQLEMDERAVLIIASVLGRKFSLKLLNAILKKAGKPPAGADVLSRLEEKQYLVNLTSDVYEFRHDLLHEIVYRELKKDLRKNVHALAAAAIEEIYSANLSAHYYELARHFEDAGDEANTIKYLEKAGDKARDNYENDRAERYYNKLLKLENNALDNVSIQLKLCDVYMNRDQWDKQIEICGQLLKKNRKLKSNLRIECLKRIGYCFRLKGDYALALVHYKKAMRIANANGDLRSKLDLMEHEAKVLMNMGNYKESLASFEMIYKISIKSNFKDSLLNSLMGLGIVNAKMANYYDAIKYNNLLNNISISANNIQCELASIINTAEAYYFMGEYDLATSEYQKALYKAKKQNFQQQIAICLGNLGIIYQTKHKFRRALEYFQNLLKHYRNIGFKPGISRSLGQIGSCLISLCNFNEALCYLKKQLKISKQLKRKQSIATCVGNIGIIYSQIGEYDKALVYFKKQLLIDSKSLNPEGMFRAYLNIGILYRNSSNYKKCKKFISKALIIANNTKLRCNLSIGYSYYSEALYWLHFYSDSIHFAKKAIVEANNINNKILKLHSICFLKKAQIAESLIKHSPEVSNLTKEYGEELKIHITSSNSLEEKALLYYEAVQFYLLTRNSKRVYTRRKIDMYFKKSIIFYHKLYEKTLISEYKSRLIDLRNLHNKERELL